MAELYQQFSLLNPKPSFDDSNGETPPHKWANDSAA